MPAKKPAGYSAADIQNLSARDQVRLRPSTYIGGTGTSSLVHLVDEVLANSARHITIAYTPNRHATPAVPPRNLSVGPAPAEITPLADADLFGTADRRTVDEVEQDQDITRVLNVKG